MKKVTEQVKSYINHLNYGKVFTFNTVREHTKNASKDTINHVLKKEVLNDNIIHIRKGLYTKPKMSRFGPIPIGPDKVVQMLAKESGAVIYPSGTSALNAIGLATQLPMTCTYIATKRISSFKNS